MENLLFLGVPILKHFRVWKLKYQTTTNNKLKHITAPFDYLLSFGFILSYSENRVLGAWPVVHISLLVMNRLN